MGARGYSFQGADPVVILPASKNEDPAASDEESEIVEIADGDLSAIQAGTFEPCKLVCTTSHCNHLLSCQSYPTKVLVVRTDLKMTPGKIAAQ